MKVFDIKYPLGTPDDFRHGLYNFSDVGCGLQYGTGYLKKGMKTPIEGDFTVHDQMKIVVIVEGKVALSLKNGPSKPLVVSSGDSFLVERFEAHSGEALEDTKLLYILFGATQNDLSVQ
ncbi:MAG: hypothetical protein AB3N16_06155 [Flavobacteriaceae bacterium]